MKICKLNLDIADERWIANIADIEKVSEQVKDTVFADVGARGGLDFLPADKEVSVNVCLSDDEQVHTLNRDFRGMDKPTNVLSFANVDYRDFADESELFGSVELGDIIIAFETMDKEAQIESISLKNHYCHLLAHGLLHILGFDHIEEDEAKVMEGYETEILAQLGIENPYKDFCD